MYGQLKDRLFLTSLALAAGGILACLAVMLDTFMPKGSAWAFLAALLPLGLGVVGLVLGFTWVCDKVESRVRGPLERLLGNNDKPWAVTAIRGEPLPKGLDGHPQYKTPAASFRLGDYPLTLRVSVRPTVRRSAASWHGQ